MHIFKSEIIKEKNILLFRFSHAIKSFSEKENKENYLNESRYLMISMSTSNGKLIKVAVGNFALDKLFALDKPLISQWFD